MIWGEDKILVGGVDGNPVGTVMVFSPGVEGEGWAYGGGISAESHGDTSMNAQATECSGHADGLVDAVTALIAKCIAWGLDGFIEGALLKILRKGFPGLFGSVGNGWVFGEGSELGFGPLLKVGGIPADAFGGFDRSRGGRVLGEGFGVG